MAGLNEKQKDELVQRLRGMRAALLDTIRAELLRSDAESYTALADRVHDIGDESVAALMADVDLAAIDRELAELRDVEEALARAAQGAYGKCMECGSDIGYERLNAYPTAKRCRDDQQRHEQQYAHPNTPRM